MFEIESRPYDHPDVVRLVAELQAEYVAIYGGPDETPVEPGEFDPPNGLFLVGLLAGEPVGAGGWRRIDGPQPSVEIKRMYVVPRCRGRGLSRLLLAELERTAAAAGYARVVLMTAEAQPEAIGLYESSGYLASASYGIYACEPDARFYRKDLVAASTEWGGVPGAAASTGAGVPGAAASTEPGVPGMSA